MSGGRGSPQGNENRCRFLTSFRPQPSEVVELADRQLEDRSSVHEIYAGPGLSAVSHREKAIAQNKPVGARDMLADAPKDVGVVLWPDAVMVVTPLYNGRVPHFRQQRPHRSG